MNVEDANRIVFALMILAAIGFIAIMVEVYREWKMGFEQCRLNFTSCSYALPNPAFNNNNISDKVIVKLEAGTNGNKTVVYEVDTYDHNKAKWTTFNNTATADFKVVKWANFPKV